MADSQDCNPWKRITIKLSLYDKKRRWRIWVKIFFASNMTLEMGVSPSTRMLATVTTTEKCRLLDHSWFFCNSSIFEFLKDPESKTPSFYLFSTFWTPHFFWGPNFRGGTFHVLQRFSVLKPGLHRVFTMLNWQFVISGYSHSKLTPHQLPPFSQKRHPRCSQDMWHCSPYVGIHGVAVTKTRCVSSQFASFPRLGSFIPWSLTSNNPTAPGSWGLEEAG